MGYRAPSLSAHGEAAVVIGLSGATRCGKSRLAQMLAEEPWACKSLKGAVVIHQDSSWRRCVQVQLPDGTERKSQDDPSCTDNEKFVREIREARSRACAVIVEGFQLVHSAEVRELLTHIFHIDLTKEECHKRRTGRYHEQLNPNPVSAEEFEKLIWPAHERYMAESISPLGDAVLRLGPLLKDEDYKEAVKHVQQVALAPVLVIGLSGATRSGKSRLAQMLAKEPWARASKVIGQDEYWKGKVQVKLPDGTERKSQDDPSCTDNQKFACKIRETRSRAALNRTPARSDPSIVIVEGFQLVHSAEVRALLTHIFHIDLAKEECHKRRTGRYHEQLNPSAVSVEEFEKLIWPAHEQYMAESISPLGDAVLRLGPLLEDKDYIEALRHVKSTLLCPRLPFMD
ncbi:unnamed protein product [Effrenium voratum]|uniref:Uncharacterized protein n=1 Tax=Effrenium voratum TaxID=2562239 RepID=A0AA36N8J2_9DINO|nr:unnamed protein product [Effrenium voratum]CAJ1434908.1 unnamed protein product [Effrenium voratum]